jgi:HSP20 family molecular chaperone IbpA
MFRAGFEGEISPCACVRDFTPGYCHDVAERDDERLRGEIEQLFADLWQVPRVAGLSGGFRPRADCVRADDPPRLTVVVELPGVDAEDVQISAAPRELVIEGQRAQPDGGGRYQQIEIDYGAFQRRIPLAEEVDPDGVTASYDRGLLTIVLPLARRPERPVEIEVRTKP